MSSPSTESQKKSHEGQSSVTAEKQPTPTSTSAMKDGDEPTATSAKSEASYTGENKNDKPSVDKMDTTITTSNESSKNSSNNPKPNKIKVHLVAVGSAPILKKSKFLMNADDRFVVAIAFLRKVLKLSSSTAGAASISSLFLYVNAAFVPSPDERMGDLFDCFGSRGELVIHYSLQEAWG